METLGTITDVLCNHCAAFNLHDYREWTANGTSGSGKSQLDNPKYRPAKYRFIHGGVLEKGDEAGCQFCKLLTETFAERLTGARSICDDDFWVALSLDRELTHIGLVSDRRLKLKGLQVRWMSAHLIPEDSQHDSAFRKADIGRVSKFSAAADPGSPAATSGDIIGRYLGTDPSPSRINESLEEWLVDCHGTHEQCSTTIAGDICIDDEQHVPLPSRLINISSEIPRLEDTAGKSGSYITLSHCWGSDPSRVVPTTVAANLESRKKGITLDELPKSFRDAITVVRNLRLPFRVKYLWIDSLCILQDDKDDWLRESARMARIYQFSLMTIAATGAEDSHTGLFIPRTSPSPTAFVRLPYRTHESVKEGESFIVYVEEARQSSSVYSAKLETYYESAVQRSPLQARAWCHQERLLSRRTAHFTKDRVYFECHSRSPRDETNIEMHRTLVKRFGFGVLGETLRFQFTPLDYLIDMWHGLLESYTRSNLTRPSQDKLVAISGVAAEVILYLSRSEAPETAMYLSGLLSHHPHIGLAWQAIDPQHATSCESGTPSWSWASVNGAVMWPRTSEHSYIQPEISLLHLSTSDNHVQQIQTAEKQLASLLTSNDLSATKSVSGVVGRVTPELKLRGYLRKVSKIETPITDAQRFPSLPQEGATFPSLSDLSDLESFALRLNGGNSRTNIGWNDNAMSLAQLQNFYRSSNSFYRQSHSIRDPKTGLAIGWGQFEKAHEQPASVPIYAIPLFSYEAGEHSTYQPKWSRLCCVLYLVKIDGCYRRVGMGEIFNMRYFERGEQQVITLT